MHKYSYKKIAFYYTLVRYYLDYYYLDYYIDGYSNDLLHHLDHSHAHVRRSTSYLSTSLCVERIASSLADIITPGLGLLTNNFKLFQIYLLSANP